MSYTAREALPRAPLFSFFSKGRDFAKVSEDSRRLPEYFRQRLHNSCTSQNRIKFVSEIKYLSTLSHLWERNRFN